MKSTYDFFLDTHASELQECLKKIKLMHESDNMEVIGDAFNKYRRVYDEPMVRKVEGFILSRHDQVCIRVLCDTAVENQNRFGTEARQIINLIDDVFQASGLDDFDEDDDEDDIEDDTETMGR